MWVVVRGVFLLAAAILAFVLLCGFGTAISQLVFVDTVYPVSSDVEMAVGYGLIALAAVYCLSRDLWTFSLSVFGERGKSR